MRDLDSYITPLRLIPEVVYTQASTPAAVTIDRANTTGTGNRKYEAVTIACHIGAGGITFTGTNFIALKIEESDDNSTFNVVAGPASGSGGGGAVNLGVSNQPGVNFGQQPDANGYVRIINAAKAAADTIPFTCDYVGNKRYIRVTLLYGGTHSTGTLGTVWAILGFPDVLPAA